MQSVSHPLTVISVVQRIFFWTEDTLNEDLLKILCSISLKEGDKKFFPYFFFMGWSNSGTAEYGRKFHQVLSTLPIP